MDSFLEKACRSDVRNNERMDEGVTSIRLNDQLEENEENIY